MDIIKALFEQQDLKFRDFNASLIPNIPKERVIGVKTPILKRMGKELSNSGEAERFMKCLPHAYFEEDQIHAFLISEMRDLDGMLCELEHFLPYVNNWATCDQLIPRAIAREPERVLNRVDVWIGSGETYKIRFGIGILMRYFLEERFSPIYLQRVAAVRSEEYYVNMMSAWYFATALAKQYDATLPYFSERRLSPWVHNKAISKARESRRVSEAHKIDLQGLIWKRDEI